MPFLSIGHDLLILREYPIMIRMYRLSTLLALICAVTIVPCVSQPTHSPWQTTISRTTSIEASPDGSTVLVTGQVGYLLRSADAGKTWELPISGTYSDLLDVTWVNARTAYVAGANSHVLWSTDGGATWRKVEGNIHPGQQFHHVRAVPGSERIVILSDSVLLCGSALYTEWQPLLARVGTLRSVFFYDSLQGLVSVKGEGILRTTDGGDTWEAVMNTFDMVVTDFDADIETGYSIAVLDSGEIYESHDFGASWQSLSELDLIPQTVLLDQEGGVVVGGLPREPSFLNSPIVERADSTTLEWSILHLTSHWGGEGIINITELLSGPLLSTANSGGVYLYDEGVDTPKTITLSYLYSTQVRSVAGSSFQSADTGLIISNPSGLRTTSGGATWHHSPLSGTDPFGLLYLGEREGYLWLDNYFSRLYRWKGPDHPLEFSSPELDIDDIQSNTPLAWFEWKGSPLIGYGLASPSAPIPTIYLGVTTDTGRTFRGMKLAFEDYTPLSQSFTGDGFGLITYHGQNIRVYRTTDTLHTLSFVGEFPSSGSRIQDWVVVVHSTGRAFRCRQMDDTIRAESRCELMETTDGGETWHPFHQFEGPVTLSFLTDRVWIASSSYGRLWISYDGGETWVREVIDPLPIARRGTRVYPTYFGEARLSADGRAVYMPASNGLLFRTEFEESLLGVEERGTCRSLAAITIAPNPVRDHLHLSWRNLSPADFQVFDAAGERVLSHPVAPGSTEIDLPTTTLLPPGRYQLVLRDRAGSWIASGGFVRL